MARRLNLWALLLAALLVLAACGEADDAPDDAAPPDDDPAEPAPAPDDDDDAVDPAADDDAELERVTVGVAQVSASETLYAEMEHYCADNGYGIHVDPIDVGPRFFDRVILVDQGDLDVGVGGYSTIPPIIEQGLDVVTIAGGFHGNTDLVIRDGVEVEDWSDLEGLRIGVPTGSVAEHSIFEGMRQRGHDPDAIEFEFMLPGPQATIALIRGDLDGVSGWEPWPSDFVTEGHGYIPFDVQDNEIGTGVAVIQVHRDNLDEPKIQRFVECLVDAAEHYNANDELHVEAIREWSGLALPVTEHVNARFHYDTNIYWEPLAFYAQVMYDFGLIETQATEADIENVVDYSLLEAATGQSAEELGGVGQPEPIPGRLPENYDYGPPEEDE